MQRPQRLSFLLALPLLAPSLASASMPDCDYFVSSTDGNDDFDGLLPAPNGSGGGPWKTVTKVSGQAFGAGDTVCFRRGDTWDLVDEGPLVIDDDGAAGDPITIRAYGDGSDRPRFTAARDLSAASWVPVAADEWALVNEPSLDFSNPGGRGVILIEDASHPTPTHLWRGASWSPPHAAGSLSEDHEWAWNENTGTLHVLDETGEPGAGGFTSIVAAQRPFGQGYGVLLSGSFIDVFHLEVDHVAGHAFQVVDVDTFTIADVVSRYSNTGIAVFGGTAGDPSTLNMVIDSRVEYHYTSGISAVEGNTGTVPLVHTMPHVIAGNEVHDNGQLGIFWRFFRLETGQDARVPVVDDNHVQGGGWYKQSYFGYAGIAVVYRGAQDPGPVVRYNRVHDQVTPEATSMYHHQLDGGGIMLRADRAKASYNLVYDNEGSGIAAGFMSEGPPDGVVIVNNTLYHNCLAPKDDDQMAFTKRGEIRIEGQPQGGGPPLIPTNVVVKNNIMVLDPNAMRPHLLAIFHPASMAEIDDNLYFADDGIDDDHFWVDKVEYGFVEYMMQFWFYPGAFDKNSSFEDPRIEEDTGDPQFSQLLFDSPAIDAGDDVTGPLGETPLRDFWGNAASYPTAAAWDIGAHELVYVPLP